MDPAILASKESALDKVPKIGIGSGIIKTITELDQQLIIALNNLKEKLRESIILSNYFEFKNYHTPSLVNDITNKWTNITNTISELISIDLEYRVNPYIKSNNITKAQKEMFKCLVSIKESTNKLFNEVSIFIESYNNISKDYVVSSIKSISNNLNKVNNKDFSHWDKSDKDDYANTIEIIKSLHKQLPVKFDMNHIVNNILIELGKFNYHLKI